MSDGKCPHGSTLRDCHVCHGDSATIFSLHERIAELERERDELRDLYAAVCRVNQQHIAQNARLREALQRIATSRPINSEPLATAHCDRAAQALAETPTQSLAALFEPTRELLEWVKLNYAALPEHDDRIEKELQRIKELTKT